VVQQGLGSEAAATRRLCCGLKPYLKLRSFVHGSRDLARFEIALFKFVRAMIV